MCAPLSHPDTHPPTRPPPPAMPPRLLLRCRLSLALLLAWLVLAPLGTLAFTRGTPPGFAASKWLETDANGQAVTLTTPAFTGLSDAPATYSGSGNLSVQVNTDGTGLMFTQGTRVVLAGRIFKNNPSDLFSKWGSTQLYRAYMLDCGVIVGTRYLSGYVSSSTIGTGSCALTGNWYTQLILPAAGTYEVRIPTTRCVTNGYWVAINVTRSGVRIFTEIVQTYVSDCGQNWGLIIYPNALPGDIMIFGVSDTENTGNCGSQSNGVLCAGTFAYHISSGDSWRFAYYMVSLWGTYP